MACEVAMAREAAAACEAAMACGVAVACEVATGGLAYARECVCVSEWYRGMERVWGCLVRCAVGETRLGQIGRVGRVRRI